jgi:hypothetical protein
LAGGYHVEKKQAKSNSVDAMVNLRDFFFAAQYLFLYFYFPAAKFFGLGPFFTGS